MAVSGRATAALLKNRAFGRTVAAASLLALATVSDGFLYTTRAGQSPDRAERYRREEPPGGDRPRRLVVVLLAIAMSGGFALYAH
jgi:hypothetical protein